MLFATRLKTINPFRIYIFDLLKVFDMQKKRKIYKTL